MRRRSAPSACRDGTPGEQLLAVALLAAIVSTHRVAARWRMMGSMPGASQSTDPYSRLAGLLEAEQAISARRLRLQDQIDFIRGGGGADPNASDQKLRQLLAEERTVSADRRKLQGEIDELRAVIELPPSSEQRSRDGPA